MCIQKFEVVPVSAAFGTVGRGKGNMWESSLVLISFKQRKTMWSKNGVWLRKPNPALMPLIFSISFP